MEAVNNPIRDSFRDYLHDYLATTHRQAYLAWSGGLLLSYPIDILLSFTYHPLPLVKLAALRILILGLLYVVYRKRLVSEGKEQMGWIALNFLGFAALVAWLATIVDTSTGFPAYAAAGFVITGACAHYPARAPAALLFPISVAMVFAGTYLFCSQAKLPHELTILGVLLVTSPLSTAFGSMRLHKSLVNAYELNRRLFQEFRLTAEAKARLSVTLTSISDALVATDENGWIELANSKAEVLLNSSANQIVGQPLSRVLALRSEDGTKVDILLDRDWLSPHNVYLSEDDRSLPLRVAASPIRTASGTLAGNVVVVQDMSGLWAQEEERMNQVRLESLGVLAGGIAHDFNNVLTAIKGNISLIELEIEQGSVVREILLETGLALQRASELAGQLLTFSKGGEPSTQSMAVAPLVREAVDLYTKSTQIETTLNLDPNLVADIDPTQMNQVFQNLVINAVQAMPEEGQLEVSLKAEGRYIEIYFLDSGPGIPVDIRSKIFDPYFTTKCLGSGLGLATGYSVARKHGGDLTLVDSPLGGAGFLLTLPLVDALPAEQQLAVKDRKSPRP